VAAAAADEGGDRPPDAARRTARLQALAEQWQQQKQVAAAASCLAAVSTEIYLYAVCSCQEMLRRSGRGQQQQRGSPRASVDPGPQGAPDYLDEAQRLVEAPSPSPSSARDGTECKSPQREGSSAAPADTSRAIDPEKEQQVAAAALSRAERRQVRVLCRAVLRRAGLCRVLCCARAYRPAHGSAVAVPLSLCPRGSIGYLPPHPYANGVGLAAVCVPRGLGDSGGGVRVEIVYWDRKNLDS
jgi:hypothetical protein